VKAGRKRVLFCVLMALVLTSSTIVVSGGAPAQGLSKTWHFDKASECTFNSEVIQVSGSLARLKKLPSDSFWAKTYRRTGMTHAEYSSSALDPDRNIVVVGTSENASAGYDLLVTKYDQSGNMLTGWPKFYKRAGVADSNQNIRPNDVHVDSGGNITIAANDQHNIADYDFAVWRLNAGGSVLSGWPRFIDVGGTNDYAEGVTIDNNGDIVVVGSVAGVPLRLILMKYKPNGTPVSGWPKLFDNGGSSMGGREIIQDAEGYYVVAGGANTPMDGMLAKFDAGGNTLSGWPIFWDRGLSPSQYDNFYSVSQDTNGEYCLTGISYDGPVGNPDIVLIRYNTDGGDVAGWPVIYDKDATAPYDLMSGWRGHVDTSGNIAACCDSATTGSRDSYTLKYDRAGAPFAGFPKHYAITGGTEFSFSAEVDDLDNIFTTGFSDLGGAVQDAFIVKYPPAARSTGRPFIVNETGLQYFKISGFSEKPGSGNQGSVGYQLSPDGNKFYYFDGTKWAEAMDKFSTNTAGEVSDNLGSYNTTVGPGNLYVRAYLVSDGSQKVELDSITVDYEAATTWYLAEGSTGSDVAGSFETWVLVQNPGDEDASVKLFYQTPAGEKKGPEFDLKAHTRQSVSVAETVPNEWSVSTRVTSNQPVIAERAMYWNTAVAFRQAAHDSIGVTGPSETWYLAEGSTGSGTEGFFETWVLVQNPGDSDASVKLFYQTPAGETKGPELTLKAHTRETVNVSETVPNTWSVSTRVTSDEPVIAERAMYWNPPDSVRTAAHDSIGVTRPSETWYLAEGSTGSGVEGSFETWVLVQNPGDKDASVKLNYQTPTGETAGPTLAVKAHTRQTVSVSNEVPNAWSVSTRVTSNEPVIAERAMYWNTSAAFRQAAHDSIGVTAPASAWYLAEGSTGVGPEGSFETWVLVQNPGANGARVSLFFQTASGETPGPVLNLAPNTRESVNVGETVQNEWSVSTRVSSDRPVIAERAVYWNAPGVVRRAAHDSIGFDP